MTARRLPARRRVRALPPLAGALLAAALLTGCGIRPTAVPVDAGAPASRTACPSEVQVPRAPDSAVPSVTPGPGAKPSAPAKPGPAASASPAVTVTAAPTAGGVFGAPSPSHCP